MIVLIPGPNSLYVISIAARFGRRAGFAGTAGVFCGDFMLMMLTVFGAAAVLERYPLLFQSIKIVGAVYLSWLGLQFLWHSYHQWLQQQRQYGCNSKAIHAAPSKPARAPTLATTYTKALVISLLNPKAIMFFMSFFVQFIDISYQHTWLSFLILAAIFQCASLVYLSTIICTSNWLVRFFSNRSKLSAVLNTSVGCAFIAFGVRMAG